MKKLTGIGALSIVFGLTLVIFKTIANVTGKSISLPDLTLEQALDPARLKWMEELSHGFVLTCAQHAVTTPLYLYCIVVGVILFLLGGVLGSK